MPLDRIRRRPKSKTPDDGPISPKESQRIPPWRRPHGWILPKNGRWKGQKGNSDFLPNNPDQLGLKPGEVVPFRRGFPDFSKWSVQNFRVKGLNGDHNHEMPKIWSHIAKIKGWFKPDGTPNGAKARKWLSDEKLTPHHAGGSVIQLIPTNLHGGIRHMGGAYKLRNGIL